MFRTYPAQQSLCGRLRARAERTSGGWGYAPLPETTPISRRISTKKLYNKLWYHKPSNRWPALTQVSSGDSISTSGSPGDSIIPADGEVRWVEALEINTHFFVVVFFCRGKREHAEQKKNTSDENRRAAGGVLNPNARKTQNKKKHQGMKRSGGGRRDE